MKKAAIRILDIDFNLLGEIEDYESLYFERYFDRYGEFTIKINRNKRNTEHLKKGNIVFLSPKKCGIIYYRDYSLENDGWVLEEITVKGFTLSYILSYRITDVPVNSENYDVSGNAETVMKNLTSYNLSDLCTNNNRRIAAVRILENKNRGKTIDFSTRYKKLDEECTRVSNLGEIGFDITLNYTEKKFDFDVYTGRNLTAEQTDLPPVIFSTDFDNLESYTITDSDTDYKNMAYIGGSGEGIAREIETLNNDVSGILRREIFVDARDIEAGDSAGLIDRGNEALLEYKSIYNVSGRVLPFNSFRFEEDYDLGDLVTLKLFDVSQTTYFNTRITSVSENWDTNGYECVLNFGEKVPTVIDKIKGLIKEKNIVN